MKKRVLACLLLLTLAGCASQSQPQPPAADTPPAEQPAQSIEPILSPADYPRVDGSTANLPMMAAIRAAVTGESLEQAEAMTTCRKTPEAWMALANGEADLLLVYEASEQTKKRLDEIGNELVITPIGRDALVFLVNDGNPVTGLTQEQLTDIYTGAITNWSDVGGAGASIAAFQRPEASGSQSLFMKLLMRDKKPVEAPTELRPEEMGGLVDSIAEYDNSANALGYSVYYYVSRMYGMDGLRLLDVDGVSPSSETIASGAYPLINEYYLVTRANEPANSPAAKLRAFILSDTGRSVMEQAGYVPLQE